MSKETVAAANPHGPNRRPDIDRLRALAVLLLVPFHSALISCRTGTFPLSSGTSLGSSNISSGRSVRGACLSLSGYQGQVTGLPLAFVVLVGLCVMKWTAGNASTDLFPVFASTSSSDLGSSLTCCFCEQNY
jgi:peptidoglycan/LPS O-acetylase OafA/YrhL